ncbi:hypothetical protein WJX72_005604 [[Myrmecia] bisecta]|uniref:LolA-like domain-containing protein n=1 Tax=[Myrmecia] bisecta TaxID=41462 RepID=A0AAW1QF74_9CHLO
MYAPVFPALVLFFFLAPGSTSALPGVGRALLQDLEQFTIEDGGTVFQEVSACTPGSLMQLSTTDGYSVNDIKATLELDTTASYATNFRQDDRRTWANGNSRLNVSLDLDISPANPAFPKSLEARVNTVVCGQPVDATTIYEQFDGETNTTVSAAVSFKNSNGSASSTVPFLMDYDEARSLVLYDNGQAVACCNMVPPFPDFPSEWSATVETNIVDRGYTFVMTQYYSASSNAVRVDVHASGQDHVLVQDFGQQTFVIIDAANSSNPHGVCSSRPFFGGRGRGAQLFNDTTGTIVETAQFLNFASTTADTLFTPGTTDVRGIPCEKWTQTFNSTNSSYVVDYFFPINQWLVAREDYHRLLKRIHMKGSRNGRSVEHFYEYINFRPRTDLANLVDVCGIAPQGTNCNCTAQQVAKATKGVRADADGVIIDSTPVECLNTAKAPKGFSSSQGGPYALLAVIGFVVGTLFATCTVMLYYRKVLGVSAGDKLNHSRLQEFQMG